MPLSKITLCENALDPASWTTHECEDVRRFLVDHFGEWPQTARIYLNRVGQDTDVTPYDKAGVQRLGKLNGHFFVVVYPAHISALAVLIISIALSAASIVIGYLIRPSLPENQQSHSPTNSLTNRQNKERPGGRIPDIYGKLWVIPDLIGVPYRIFIGNKEVEYTYMCIGRGEYYIAQVRDDVTPIEQIDGAGCKIYAPYTSPNSGNDPQVSYGEPINESIKNVKQYSSVNGQTLRAPNANKFKASNNVRFTDAGVVEGSGNIDFTDYFKAGSAANPNHLIISNSNYNGTYLILDVNTTQIVLSNPGSVNSAWNSLSGKTAWGSPTLLNSTDNFEGPYYIIDNTVNELWCNFVATQGLYEMDSNGNQHAMSVTVQVEVTSIDNNYNTQGSPTYYQTTLKGSEVLRTQCGATLVINLPVRGSCMLLARRMTNTDLRDGWQVVDQVQWRDLYGVSPVRNENGDAMTHFGNVTTIQTITWPTPQALSLKQRKINVLVGRKFFPDDVTSTSIQVSAKCAPWTFEGGKNAGYTFEQTGGTIAPVVVNGLQVGDIVEISASGTIIWAPIPPYTTTGAMGNASDYATNNPTHTFPSDYIENNTLGTAGLCGAFADESGNVVQAIAVGTGGNFTVPAGATRLQLGLNDYMWGDNSGYFDVDVEITRPAYNHGVPTNAADIICAMALDPYIGRRTESEIDRAGIVATLGGDGEVETYFGTKLCAEFCHAFDDSKMSFEEMMATVCQAVFCTAYRRGNVLSVMFEKKTDDSTILFNHRNKLPGTETRSIKFGTATENDGIDLNYTEPNAPNAQNIDSVVTLRFPENGSAIAPKKIDATGVRNRVQAWMLGWRLYNKLLYQNMSTQFDATSEAALCVANDRILVADNTRPDIQDGEVIAQEGLELTLSQPVTFSDSNPAPSYTIFLQYYDGTVDSIAITPSSADDKVILATAPTTALVLDNAKYARTTYLIVSDQDAASNAFLLQEKDPKDGGVYGIKAINYDDRYYEHDQDYNASPRLVDEIVPDAGSGSGYSARASTSVYVDGKTMPWVSADNPTYSYGIGDGKPPVAIPIQATEGEIVTITANAPGQAVSVLAQYTQSNCVKRSDEGSYVDAEGEDNHITADTSDSNGYFPTHHTTDKTLGRCGLVGAWAVDNKNGSYTVVEPFVIGFGGAFTVPSPGIDTLLLGINDNKFSDNKGGFQVLVTQTGLAASNAAAVNPTPDTTIDDPDTTVLDFTVNGQ